MIADYQTPRRMAAKMAAIPFPYMMGKQVLDVGCDMAHWSFLAASKGATRVLGLDRNREVRGVGHVNLVELNRIRAANEGRDNVAFEEINLGKQWREFGAFDIVFCLSVYHHIFNQCGDHAAVWYWLSRHCVGQLIWEGPVDDSDPVVCANVSDVNRGAYSREEIIRAASLYFDAEHIGPALHEPTREVWRFKPKAKQPRKIIGHVVAGAGGATAAFEYANGRRIGEIETILGFRPYPGSLNVQLNEPFDWDAGYYRAQVLDVVGRGGGLDVDWELRWARLYPIETAAGLAFAFRFEGEGYHSNFIELISGQRLRDTLDDEIEIAR
jgi:2-polyprenyl-3-methyl-5-hydroxy-6-metoxy-1,4-benzoquinol methylase